MLLISKKLLLFVNHGNSILHHIEYSATAPHLHTFSQCYIPSTSHLYPPITLSLFEAVYTMEVPTKWSRASVISFIKGLGKLAGVCLHVHTCLHHLTAQLSHKQVADYEALGACHVRELVHTCPLCLGLGHMVMKS